MRRTIGGFLSILALVSLFLYPANVPDTAAAPAAQSVTQGLRCVSFGPYVDNTAPPATVSQATINTLVTIVTQELGANCVLNYSFTNGNEYVIDWAASHGVAVVGILFLEWTNTPNYQALNDAQINAAISYAKNPQTAGTIKALSCGSEFIMRVKNLGADPTSMIVDCINRLKAAGVTQPIGSIDAYSFYCNEVYPCATYQNTALMNAIDWVGVNVYPWWDGGPNRDYCPALSAVPQYHKDVMDSLVRLYPSKQVTLVEWGWPAGPDGTVACGNTTASPANQQTVVNETLAILRNHAAGQGFLFEAFREQYKSQPSQEGPVGQYWGICDGTAPYSCHFKPAWGLAGGEPSPQPTSVLLYLPLVARTASTGW